MKAHNMYWLPVHIVAAEYALLIIIMIMQISVIYLNSSIFYILSSFEVYSFTTQFYIIINLIVHYTQDS